MPKTQFALSAQLKTLIAIKNHRLHLLNESHVKPGATTPPEAEQEIRALEDAIEALEAELSTVRATRLESLLVGEDLLRSCTAEQLRLLDDRFTHQTDKIRMLEADLAKSSPLANLANSAKAGWLVAIVALLLLAAGGFYASNMQSEANTAATAAVARAYTAVAATVQTAEAQSQPLVSAPTNTPLPDNDRVEAEQETEVETAIATPTLTPSPLAPTLSPTVPLPSPSPSPLPPTPTDSPLPVAAETATPTATLTLTPTATLAPLPELTLLEARPADDPNATTEFVWQSSRPLAENEGFEVRVWQAGENPLGVHDALLDNAEGRIIALGDNRYSLTVDLRTAPGVDEAGEYLWTVLLIQTSPEYSELGPAAPPVSFEYGQ